MERADGKSARRRWTKEKLRRTAIVFFWLSVWQLIAMGVNNPILLATPVQALRSLMGVVRNFVFWQTVGCSLLRIGMGFLMGFSAALVLSVLAFRFRFAEELLSPVMLLLKAVPVASFVVLLLIWWGASFLAAAVCFLVVLPQIYVSTLEGLKNADKKLLEMAAVFHMPLRNRFFYIYRPALKPFLLSSLKIALGMCWKSGVAAEVIGTPDFSIGERLYLSKIYLDTAGVFAWTAVVILCSFLFEKIVLRVADRFFVWEPVCAAAGGRMRSGEAGTGESREAGAAESKGTGASVSMAEDTGRSAALCCKGLSKSYGSLAVIRDWNAVYEPGRTYYLTSPSGSGKTTLLRLLAGLEKPDEGAVEPGLRFGYAFQEDRLCEEYSALRNVEMVVGGEKSRGSSSLAEEALRVLLPEEALCKPCGRLSGGMRRRVALVRAMEAESDCVLLDEPFTGMDADTARAAEEYIRSRLRGRILIIATHSSFIS